MSSAINIVDFANKFSEEFKDYEITPEYIKQRNQSFKKKLSKETELYKYQKLPMEYLFKSSFNPRGLLLYHELGSGKTLEAIYCAENSDRDVVIMLPKSLEEDFKEEIIKFRKLRPPNYFNLSHTDQKVIDKQINIEINKKYQFVSSNAPNTAEQLRKISEAGRDTELIFDEKKSYDKYLGYASERLQSIGGLDDKFLIMDEAHELVSTITSPDSKNGEPVLRMIYRARNLKILMLSGSPIVNDPYDFGIMMNILRGRIFPTTKDGKPEMEKDSKGRSKKIFYTAFPEDYQKFRDIFITGRGADRHINPDREHIFLERIVGLVSYYGGIKDMTQEILPIVNRKPHIIKVPMGLYQWKNYIIHRHHEIELERIMGHAKGEIRYVANKKPGRDTKTTYRVLTRKVCDFALPEYIKQKKMVMIEDEDDLEKIKKARTEMRKQRVEEIKRIYHEIKDEDLMIVKKTDMKKAKTGLHEFSTKMKVMFEMANKSPGNVVVYSQYISLEGNGIFGKVLEANGFINFNKLFEGDFIDPDMSQDQLMDKLLDKKMITPFHTFAIWSGGVTLDQRKMIQNIYNHPKNAHGKYIKIILITEAGARGIDLFNVRLVLLMEPFWNEARIQQVIGRAVRINSHSALPKAERRVETYLFLSVAPEGMSVNEILGEENNFTTDEYLYDKSSSKQRLIDEFLKLIKIGSIDCSLYFEEMKDDIEGCFKCSGESDGLMYTPDIDLHIIPGYSDCIPCVPGKLKEDETLEEKTINGKKYYIDKEDHWFTEIQPGIYQEVAQVET
jgi:superfamily II DNA or RNA helicase